MRLVLFGALAPLAIVACSEAVPKQQQIEQAWVRLPAVAGNPAAAYFTIRGGSVADRLMSVSSPLAVRAELHDMSMEGGASTGSEGSMMKMAAIEGGVELAKNATISFAPGGKHVMLFDVSPQASAGRKIPLNFAFASGVTLTHEADLVAAGDDEPHAH
jgi:periplasmic copper chaperone A